jgi:hypothetical protein
MADSIETAIVPLLKQQAERLRRDAPHRFEESRTSDMFQFFIANSTSYVSKGYKISVNPDQTIQMVPGTKDCVGNACKAGMVLRLGRTEAIDSFVTSGQHERFKSYDDEATYFVNLEISSHPTDTSLPIDLLEITNAGIEWRNQKAECRK